MILIGDKVKTIVPEWDDFGASVVGTVEHFDGDWAVIHVHSENGFHPVRVARKYLVEYED